MAVCYEQSSCGVEVRIFLQTGDCKARSHTASCPRVLQTREWPSGTSVRIVSHKAGMHMHDAFHELSQRASSGDPLA